MATGEITGQIAGPGGIEVLDRLPKGHSNLRIQLSFKY